MSVSEALMWWNIIRCERGQSGIVLLSLSHFMPSLQSNVKRHYAAALHAHSEQSDINIKCTLHSHELLSYNVPYVACIMRC